MSRQQVDEAIKRIQGKEKLNEVLKDYPSELKADILKALRESKEAGVLLNVRTARYALWKVSKLVQAKHKGVPSKVDEIAHAIERDTSTSPEVAHRMAWESYCSYINPDYEGCTPKGKSERKSPKSEYGE